MREAHICNNGIVRPYHPSFCSMCKPGMGNDFTVNADVLEKIKYRNYHELSPEDWSTRQCSLNGKAHPL